MHGSLVLIYSGVVAHEETIARHNMRVESGPDGLINGLGEAASNLTKAGFMNRHLVDIVSSNTSWKDSAQREYSGRDTYVDSSGTVEDADDPVCSRSSRRWCRH